MGSIFSSPTPPDPPLPITEQRRAPYYGVPVPPEASKSPQDSQSFYDDFFEKACCVPHKDGKSIIIFWLLDPNEIPDPREPDGWAVRRLRKIYEMLNGNHPRIVRYLGSLECAESIVVEKVSVGPLKTLILPKISVPMPAVGARPRQDQVILSLYYRWALQALSAISFMHSRSIYIKFFSSSLVWLRSDYSLAITGFVDAISASEYLGSGDWDSIYLNHGDAGMWAGDESFLYEDFSEETPKGASIKEDLFYWATFVWRLMTNEYASEAQRVPGQIWDPVCPMHGVLLPSTPGVREILKERAQKGLVQELEEERLGSVLVKAWNGHYESAHEIANEIKLIASIAGITTNGDEVELDEGWENAFEIFQSRAHGENRELQLKSQSEKLE